MTDQQWRDFVSAGTRTGKLVTTRANGSPHVTPIWFLLDGDDVVFNTEADGVNGRNLTRDDRFALSVDDDQPPYVFVILQGRVSVLDDPAQANHWAGRLGARCMGEDRVEEYATRNGSPGNLLVRAHVEKVIAFAGIAD